jgi:hypothetical protein
VKPTVVGAAEIGQMLGGLSRQRVSQLMSVNDFPDPLAPLKMGNVYRFDDVVEWAQRHGRTVYPIDL